MQTMQSNLFYCKISLHVSGVTAPINRSAKNCNHSLRYRSYCEIHTTQNVLVRLGVVNHHTKLVS